MQIEKTTSFFVVSEDGISNQSLSSLGGMVLDDVEIYTTEEEADTAAILRKQKGTKDPHDLEGLMTKAELSRIEVKVDLLLAERNDLLTAFRVSAGYLSSFGLSTDQKQSIVRAHALCRRILLLAVI